MLNLVSYISLIFIAGGRGIHRPLDSKKSKSDPQVHTGSEFKSKVSTKRHLSCQLCFVSLLICSLFVLLVVNH